ncbi:FAD-binding protein [Gordonia sp. PP30]|uniref:D-arabinono-1,4-lactone oxidase n=1 Tax=Gordonia sp. PP30 TaxID=2935861 RepID=UPI0020003C67|nr:D-arabinono-1,4-lactone oxidase [Gordonia sp. PP30]UQE73296.1 FAD-binding protein [Gordonia sp. PP30]
MTITNGTWTNWAGDESAIPARILTPATVEELSTAVAAAAAAGQTVRVVGAGHSFSDLVATDGLLLSLDRLAGIAHYDADAGLVTIGAGTRLYDLNPALDALGVALPNLGDVDQQSFAGASSTATHGTGRLLGNLATGIESMDLVLADGSTLTCSGDDPDTLAAARVSLGALGVATSYRLKVVPAFALAAREFTMPMPELTARLDELIDTNDHFEFFHFPHTGAAMVKLNNRTDRPLAPRGELAARANEFLENTVVEGASRLGRRLPRAIPVLNRTLTALASGSEYVDRSYRVYASKRAVRFTEMEFAVPRSACLPVLDDLARAIEREGFAVNFPVEVRFVAGDTDSYLSPSYDRETCYIAVHMFRGMPWRPYFRAFEDIASAYDGRPHWGKRHLLDAEALAGRYPEWDRFQDVRSRLDPGGVFTNDHIRRVLGPVRPA